MENVLKGLMSFIRGKYLNTRLDGDICEKLGFKNFSKFTEELSCRVLFKMKLQAHSLQFY